MCLCDVSEYLRLADCRLFNRTQSSSHFLSHLLPPEKHHLGLRPRGHRYTLPICPNELCKFSFIPPSLFSFLWFFFHLQCLIYSVLYYCITFVFVIFFKIKRYHQLPNYINFSVIEVLAMGQIPRSTQHISSYWLAFISAYMCLIV